MSPALIKLCTNRRFHLAGLVFGSLLSFQACINGKSKDNQYDGPPTLKILALENTEGERFEPDERIIVACDQKLTVLLGPSTATRHLLDNWDLRPPGNCDTEQKQCGFIRLSLEYADKTKRTVEGASLAIALHDEFVIPELKSVTATLIDGRDGSVFLVEGQAVSTQTDVSLSFAECPISGSGGDGGSGPGGDGGADGTPDPTPGGSSFGGASQ